MKPSVDIEGSGQEATVIQGLGNNASLPETGVIEGAASTELRNLQIKSVGSASHAHAIALFSPANTDTQVWRVACEHERRHLAVQRSAHCRAEPASSHRQRQCRCQNVGLLSDRALRDRGRVEHHRWGYCLHRPHGCMEGRSRRLRPAPASTTRPSPSSPALPARRQNPFHCKAPLARSGSSSPLCAWLCGPSLEASRPRSRWPLSSLSSRPQHLVQSVPRIEA